MRHIVSDIDGVIANWVDQFLMERINPLLKTNYTADDITAWNLADVLPISEDEFTREFDKFVFSYGFKRLKPYPGSAKAYNELSDKNIRFTYLSFRPHSERRTTMDWLKKHNFPNSDRVYISKNKGSVLQNLNPDLFIEDNITNALESYSLGFNTLLVRRPWNKHPVFGLTDIPMEHDKVVMRYIKDVEEVLLYTLMRWNV